MVNKRITGDMVVLALKALKRSVSAKEIAAHLGTKDTRAIATAARGPAEDGRISLTYRKRYALAQYRFVRMKPRTSHE